MNDEGPSKQIAQVGPFWGAALVAIMVSLVGYGVCQSGFFSGVAGIFAGAFAFYVMRINQHSADTLSPPAMPYKMSAEDALVQVKKALSAKYFRQQKWLLDDPDPDEMELKYTYKSIEANAAQSEKKERLVSLTVRVEPVGSSGASVELNYHLAGGVSGDFYDKNAIPSPDIQEICKSTTQFIMETLKIYEAKVAPGG